MAFSLHALTVIRDSISANVGHYFCTNSKRTNRQKPNSKMALNNCVLFIFDTNTKMHATPLFDCCKGVDFTAVEGGWLGYVVKRWISDNKARQRQQHNLQTMTGL